MQIRPQVQNQKSEGGLFYLAWEDNLVSYAIQAKKKMRDWEGSNIEKLNHKQYREVKKWDKQPRN